jgi:hypothetical protein
MSALAAWLAKKMWGHMLWLMRRPWMKRLQRTSLQLWGEPRRQRALASLRRQNRFARRYGLSLLTVAFNVLLASVAITATVFVALIMLESGYLTAPAALTQRGDVTQPR